MKIILRFDDLCPTMNHGIWDDLSRFLIDQNIKPIIAVVPDNKDPKLKVDKEDINFWAMIRNLQSLGWSIALHGSTHELVECHGSKIFFAKLTEFTHLDYNRQLEKIENGIRLLNSHGVSSEVFVAPAHSYNDSTIQAVQKTGFSYISDGMFLFPYRDNIKNITYVPQQLWSFRRPTVGTWTICCHHNKWDEDRIKEFKHFVVENRRFISSLNEIKINSNFLVFLPNILFGLFARIIFFFRKFI